MSRQDLKYTLEQIADKVPLNYEGRDRVMAFIEATLESCKFTSPGNMGRRWLQTASEMPRLFDDAKTKLWAKDCGLLWMEACQSAATQIKKDN